MARYHKKQKPSGRKFDLSNIIKGIECSTVPPSHNPNCLALIPWEPAPAWSDEDQCFASVVALRPGEDLFAATKSCIDFVIGQNGVYTADRVYTLLEETQPMFIFNKPFGALATELLLREDLLRKSFGQIPTDPVSVLTAPSFALRFMKDWAWAGQEILKEDPQLAEYGEDCPQNVSEGIASLCDRLELKSGEPCPWNAEIHALQTCLDYLEYCARNYTGS